MSNTISGRRTSFAGRSALLSLAVVGVASQAFAASATWLQAGADGNFANGANWDTGTAPGAVGTTTNGDTATFGRNTPGTNSSVVIDANRNLLNITLNPSVAGSTTFSYAFSGGPLVLSDGGTIAAGTAGNTGLGSSSFANALNLVGSGTINADFNSTNRLLTVSGNVTGGTANGTLTLAGGSGGTHVLSGIIANGSGATLGLIKSGGNTWQLSGANTFTGGISLNGGTLLSTSATPGGATATNLGTNALTFNGGTLRLSATSSTLTNSVVVGAGGGSISTKGSTLAMSSTTGSGTLNIGADAGSVVTPSNNSFGAFTGTLNVGGGFTFRLGTSLTNFDATNALAGLALNLNTATSVVARGFVTNNVQTTNIGTLSGVTGSTFGGQSGTGTGTGTFTYSVGARNENSTFAGTLIDVGTSGTKTALTKVGTGALTLSGADTYTGATNVTGGTLALGNGGSIANSASITIGANGTFDVTGASGFALGSTQGLSLAGTFKGTLAANAATVVTPGGAGTAGAANANNTTLASGSAFNADVGAAGGDVLNVVGTIDLANATLNVAELSQPAQGQVFTIVNNDGADLTSGTFNNLADNTQLTAGGDTFRINYNVGDGNDVTLTALTGTAVPEPTTLAAIGLSGVVLLKRRRRA